MKRVKRLTSLLLCFALLMGLLPAVAFAADGDKAIQAGAGGINGYSYVYFGNYQQSSYTPGNHPQNPVEGVVYTDADGTQFVYAASPKNGETSFYYSIEPIKWCVLDTASDYVDAVSGAGLLLISDCVLDTKPWHEAYNAAARWSNNTLRSWLNGYGAAANLEGSDYSAAGASFFDCAFSGVEQGALLTAAVKTETVYGYGGTFSTPNSSDRLFVLSLEEAESYFSSNSLRKAGCSDYAHAAGVQSYDGGAIWWLRSPGTDDTGSAAYVALGGSIVTDRSSGLSIGVRPAFYLDPGSVLFTSAAVGGKTKSGAAAGAIFEIEGYAGNEWKLTLKDDSRNGFTAAAAAVNGSILTVSYSGAKTGANEYISAIIADGSGAYTHYGRVKNIASDADTSGTVTIDLSGIDMTGKTLYVFNEQYNGGANDDTKLTDYASALQAVPVYPPQDPGGPDTGMSNPFADVFENDYFYQAVLWAVDNGVTTGTDAATFSPQDTCTRAQVVTFLYRGAGSPAVSGTNGFIDVSAGSYYTNAVAWAVENGITAGIGGGLFGSDQGCTRAQAVTFLYRMAGSPAVERAGGFSDVEPGSFYENAVAWAVHNGITNGTGADTFEPNATCTRAQIVTFIYRYLEGK